MPDLIHTNEVRDVDRIVSLLEQDTPATFRASGPSMNPTIRDGEPVRVRPFQAGDLRPGALLLYRKNRRLVLHRLIRFFPEQQTLKSFPSAMSWAWPNGWNGKVELCRWTPRPRESGAACAT
jgi:signal peptidase I